MVYDGICNFKIVQELQNIIGAKINKVYEPNKNTIILEVYKNGNNLYLLSCISPNNYRTHLTTHQFSNPSSAPNFCMLLRKHLIGFKISKIYTPNLERIIFIELENRENPNKIICKKLVIELMGKHSNIILTNENNIIIDSLRHTSTETKAQRDIYPTSRYLLPQKNKLDLLEISSAENFYNIIKSLIKTNPNEKLNNIICNNFNGISKTFLSNIPYSFENLSKENVFNIYFEIINTINSYNTKNYTLNYSIDNFYFDKENAENFKTLKNNIYTIVTNALKKENKKLSNINKKLEECDQMEKYRLYGELITTNLYKFSNSSNHLKEITVENYYDNNNLVSIPLDTKYSISYNSKKYFKKYSKLKNAIEIVGLQKQETLNEINYIESVLYEIENATNLTDLHNIQQEILYADIFNIKNNTNKSSKKAKASTFKPLEFNIEDYKIYVGKNNKENDYLTTKLANKNDIWFHVKDAPGSHVILKTHPNEIIPNNILLEAAKLAASHSKAKNSSNILVDYCLVRFVKKPNHSKPGFVIYKNNKTINV